MKISTKDSISYGVIGLGIFLGIAAFAVDLVSSSQGFGYLQILMLVIGIVLVLVGLVLRKIGASILGLLASALFSTLLLEGLLALVGMQPTYTWDLIQQDTVPLNYAPYWYCDDELGCRFIRENLPADFCENPTGFEERTCHLNAQGYYDENDFVASSELESTAYRILILGDSFTAGASADYGQSYVELLKARFAPQNVLIWNLGIGGTGTNQALALAEHYVPMMQPNLVILAVYENDLYENLFPLNFYTRFQVGDKYPYVYLYDLDENAVPRLLSEYELYYRGHGVVAPHNGLERLARLTRIGTKIADVFNHVQADNQVIFQRSRQQTQAVLSQLNAYLTSQAIPLLLLHIPSYQDLSVPSPEYAIWQNLIAEQRLGRLDLRDMLTLEAYAELPDTHWNNTGHAIAADILGACLDEFMLTQTCSLMRAEGD